MSVTTVRKIDRVENWRMRKVKFESPSMEDERGEKEIRECNEE